jgi:hypothetical protein
VGQQSSAQGAFVSLSQADSAGSIPVTRSIAESLRPQRTYLIWQVTTTDAAAVVSVTGPPLVHGTPPTSDERPTKKNVPGFSTTLNRPLASV